MLTDTGSGIDALYEGGGMTIVFQRLRNATMQLQFPGVTFTIEPWQMDAFDLVEREQAEVRSTVPCAYT